MTAAWLVRGSAQCIPLRDGSVQCVVTSPPYFGLRSYGGQACVWGGDPSCLHDWALMTSQGMTGGHGASSPCQSSTKRIGAMFGGGLVSACTLCGAWRGELGSERTPQEFVAHLVEVFREVKRVLRPDGVCWLNIGDSYAGSGKGPTGCNGSGNQTRRQGFRAGNPDKNHGNSNPDGLGSVTGSRPKSLLLVPERLAIALSDDGWIIRSRIAWCKAAPMPESVRDRPTSAWEHVWLLSKSGRYYWDADAVREKHSAATTETGQRRRMIASGKFSTEDEFAGRSTGQRGGVGERMFKLNAAGANMRNWWLLPPDPYPGAHFACVDQQTEALTVNGWKRHDQLQVGELIASYGMDDQRLRWRPLEAVAQYDVADQPMVLGKTASLDMLLTPNHRCVIQRRRIRGDRAYLAPKIKRADALNREDAIPTTATWDEAGEPFDRNWAELLGWYVAEGHESKMSLAVEIYQSLSVNEKKVERLRELLYAVGAEWTEATGARTWRGRDAHQTAFRVLGYAAARLRELAPAKVLQPFILSWSHDALASLMAGLVGGDGHTRKDDGRLCFVQKSKSVIDIVQAIAIRLGWSATLTPRPDNVWTLYFTRHNRRSFRGTAGRGQNIATTIYSGVVWCPKTSDGTWVARRNGTVWITGNTFPREIPRRCIAASTREGDIVLDPFSGSGTTIVVAASMGRRGVGVELSAEYVAQARYGRLAQEFLPLGTAP